MTITPLNILAAGGTDIAGMIKQWFDAIGPLGKYLGALLIFIIGGMIAKGIGKAVKKIAGGLDSKLSKYVGDGDASASGLLGTLARYFFLLFVIIFALDFAGMSQVTQPLNEMFGKIMGFIPNIIGAGIIGYLFYFLATIVKSILTSVMSAARLDERLGMDGEKAPIANGLATAAFALILLMGIAAALGTLGIDAISEPVQGILASVFKAVPLILVAAVIMAVGVFIAGLVKNLIVSLLQGINADAFPQRMGLNLPTEGSKSLSAMVGTLVSVSIIVIMSAAALKALQIEMLGSIAESIVPGYFNVLLALLIVGAGLVGGKYVHDFLVGKNALLARIAQTVIIVMASVAALSRSGIAPDITSAPYQAALTGLALALGLGGGIAFGLGGKDAVHRWLEKRGH